jgi:hypothetical protein
MGRYVFAAAAFAFGLVALAWPGYYDSLRLAHLSSAGNGWVFADVASLAQVIGGAAIAFRRTAVVGGLFLSAVYLLVALLCVPQIVAEPRTYDRWGNFFEQFSLAVGAAIVFLQASSIRRRDRLARAGRVLFGLCTVSFCIEQAIHIDATAGLVPTWLPPGQTFWAMATTVAFALAALALLANRWALFAIRQLTLMLVLFGILVWIPLLFANPHSHANWSETAETFAIAGTAWILADLLGAVARRVSGNSAERAAPAR